MSIQSPTYHSRLYRDFQEIDHTAYRTVVRFYETYADRLENLDFEEYFDLQVVYCQALFEIGAYQKHLALADRVIETSIEQGIQRWNGKDVFSDTLFPKAASHYNLLEFDRAEHILRELLRMHPEAEEVQALLRTTLRRRRSSFIQGSRAVSMSLFLLAALVICVEMIFVRTLYAMYEPLIQTVRTSIFAVGVLVLVGSDGWHRLRVHRRVAQWTAAAKSARQRRRERALSESDV